MKKLKSFKGALNTRTLKYGSNSIILIAMVIAIALILNVVVGMADLSWDLTSNKLFTIGDVSKDILKNLNKDVEVIGLFDDGKPPNKDYEDVMELLKQYDKYDRVKVTTVDPDKNPGFVKDLDKDNLKGIEKNDFVVKSGTKIKKLAYLDLIATQTNQYSYQQEKIGSKAEQSITGAIRYVAAEKTPTVYFTQGHKELTPESDLTIVKTQLENNNYDVKGINLITQESVPDDASALLVVAPQQDLLPDEKQKIKDYLEEGGDAIFMFDSLEKGSDFVQFNELLKNYNVSVNNDKVKEADPDRHYPNNPYNVLVDVSQNDIVPQKFSTLFADSRSINLLKNEKDYITVTSLVKTSDKATGIQIDRSKGNDLAGPLDLAVAIDHMGGMESSKMLVLGNASFIADNSANVLGDYYGNGMYFFLSALNWMIGKEDVLMIPAKLTEVEKLQISQLQATVTMYLSIGLLPLFILGVGAFVWLRRRHL